MPKKRPLEVRMAEAREKMDRMELEMRIRELRQRLPKKRRPTRRNR